VIYFFIAFFPLRQMDGREPTGHPAAFMIRRFDSSWSGRHGPIFPVSDTWQLVINTGTTIVTFLMVFLIQNTQNRDKPRRPTQLDEVIRAVSGAHNALLDLEELERADSSGFRRAAMRTRAQLHAKRCVVGIRYRHP